MATVSFALCHVKQRLESFVSDQAVFQLCTSLKHTWRKRQLDPALTVRLFLLQLLAGVAMTGLRHVSKVWVTAQAICAAKRRLPLQLLMEIVKQSVRADAVESTWHGLRVFLADGMSFMTQDTPGLVQQYGKAKNHKGVGHGYPNPKLLALMDLAGGFIHQVIALPWSRQEFTCLSRLFKAVGKNGLLLGDRGLVSFTHLALLIQHGVAGCFRLPKGQVIFADGKRLADQTKPRKKRPAKGKHQAKGKRSNRKKRRRIRQRGQRLARQDILVQWRSSIRPKWVSKRRWAGLANQELQLRQIAFRVTRPGFPTHWAWLITTLLDPKQYPAQDLIDLYSKRWQIEVYFRDIKKTLKMSPTGARTVEGTRKEILAFVLLYNLIRQVMAEAATRQKVAADRISFVDALRWLLWSSPGDPMPPLVINPQRRERDSPARRIKAGRHRFAQLNGSRAQTSKPPYTAKL